MIGVTSDSYDSYMNFVKGYWFDNKVVDCGSIECNKSYDCSMEEIKKDCVEYAKYNKSYDYSIEGIKKRCVYNNEKLNNYYLNNNSEMTKHNYKNNKKKSERKHKENNNKNNKKISKIGDSFSQFSQFSNRLIKSSLN